LAITWRIFLPKTPDEINRILETLAKQDPKEIAELSAEHPWINGPEGSAVVMMMRNFNEETGRTQAMKWYQYEPIGRYSTEWRLTWDMNRARC
jgi:hypothetical protein